PLHVVGCPEAHDLQEPPARRVGAMLHRKVGKDQRAGGSDRLRLADHIPCGCEPSELPREALLQEAVVAARRTGGKDRIASLELQRETAPVEDTFCSQAEAWTPRQEGHELAECPTIEAGVAKQRKRSHELLRRGSAAGPLAH